MDRVADLRADYEALGVLLKAETDGAKAAALVRERRMVGDLLTMIESPEEASVVDELARRRPPSEDAGPPSRRRRSGRG